MKFECPNDGPFEADAETRSTTPVAVKHRASVVKEFGVKDADGVVRLTTDASAGEPVVVEREVAEPYQEPTGPAREVQVGVCPECGSPIVAG